MSNKKCSPSQCPHIVAINVSDRYFSTEKLKILAGRPGSNELPKFCEAHWPPPLLEPTPELYSTFFGEALGLDKELLRNSKFFVDSPITLAKGVIRDSERSLPDIDPDNVLVGPSLKNNNLPSRNRSSLELFRALLADKTWRDIFRIEEKGDRNLYEVHLGPLAEFELAGDKRRRGKPQDVSVRKTTANEIAKAYNVKQIKEEELPEDRKRLYMTYLIGYRWLMQTGNCPWRLFGSALLEDHGVWREGEVIGFDMEPYGTLSLSKPPIPNESLPANLSLYKNNIWVINQPTGEPPKQSVDGDMQIAYSLPDCKVSRFDNKLKSFSKEETENTVTITQSLATRLQTNQGTYFRIHPCSLSVPSNSQPTYVYLSTWKQLRSVLIAGEITVKYTDGLNNNNRITKSLSLILIAIVETPKPNQNAFFLREFMLVQGIIQKQNNHNSSIIIRHLIYLKYLDTDAKQVHKKIFYGDKSSVTSKTSASVRAATKFRKDDNILPRLMSFDQYKSLLD
jgi:hypothetical protein